MFIRPRLVAQRVLGIVLLLSTVSQLADAQPHCPKEDGGTVSGEPGTPAAGGGASVSGTTGSTSKRETTTYHEADHVGAVGKLVADASAPSCGAQATQFVLHGQGPRGRRMRHEWQRREVPSIQRPPACQWMLSRQQRASIRVDEQGLELKCHRARAVGVSDRWTERIAPEADVERTGPYRIGLLHHRSGVQHDGAGRRSRVLRGPRRLHG